MLLNMSRCGEHGWCSRVSGSTQVLLGLLLLQITTLAISFLDVLLHGVQLVIKA